MLITGILKPQRYQNVYFKSMQLIDKKDECLNPNPETSSDKLSLNEIEPKIKTKKEVEKIKLVIKDILKRRFDFTDDYINQEYSFSHWFRLAFLLDHLLIF